MAMLSSATRAGTVSPEPGERVAGGPPRAFRDERGEGLTGRLVQARRAL